MHGLVWASAVGVALVAVDARPLQLTLFAVAVMSASAFASLAFDLRAALWFAAGPMAATLLAAVALPGHGLWPLAVMAGLVVGLAAQGARRGQAVVRDRVRLQLLAQHGSDDASAQQDRADAAQHRLAERLAEEQHLNWQLLQGTRQGFLFVDNEHRVTDLNPAMAQLLGHPREAVIGAAITGFFCGPDLRLLQNELLQRA